MQLPIACPHCGHHDWWPVEPYHELRTVAKMLETTPNYMRKWICSEPYFKAFPAVYRKDPVKRLHRMLPESMVRKMLAWRYRKLGL